MTVELTLGGETHNLVTDQDVILTPPDPEPPVQTPYISCSRTVKIGTTFPTDRENFAAAITEANDLGNVGVRAGITIELDGEYELGTGALPDILSDHVSIRPCGGRGNASLNWTGANLFGLGERDGFLPVGFELTELVLLGSGGYIVEAIRITDVHIEDNRLGNATSGLLKVNGSTVNNENEIISNIHVINNTGIVANWEQSLIHIIGSAGAYLPAGVWIMDNNVSVAVGFPGANQPTQVHTVLPDRDFLRVEGRLDTLKCADNSTNRFARGEHYLANVTGAAISNVKSHDNWHDYTAHGGLVLNHQGGILHDFEQARNWWNSTEGAGASIISDGSGTGFVRDIDMEANASKLCGTHGVQLHEFATGVSIRNHKVRGVGRKQLPNNHGIHVPDDMRDFEIVGTTAHDMSQAAGISMLPDELVHIGANCDDYHVTGHRMTHGEITTGANSTASANRRISGNTGFDYKGNERIFSGPAGNMPVSGTEMINDTPFTKQVCVYGKKTVNGVDINDIASIRYKPDGGYERGIAFDEAVFIVEPGDSYTINYNNNSSNTSAVIIEKTLG